MAHQSFQGVRRFRLTPFFFLVAYRLRIFDHRGQPVDRLTVRAGDQVTVGLGEASLFEGAPRPGLIRGKAVQNAHFSPCRGYPSGNDLLCSMLFRAASLG